MPDEGLGIDFEGEVAVIVTDVPMGASRAAAAASIVLIVLVNDVSLRTSFQRNSPRGSASSVETFFGVFAGRGFSRRARLRMGRRTPASSLACQP